jgi:hypothetical protein
MAVLIPETVTRLQATAFVNDAELSNIGRNGVIRLAADKLAESALRKILNDCIKTEGGYMGFRGQTLMLDVYVLSPQELHKMLVEAAAQGERDALHWTRA